MLVSKCCWCCFPFSLASFATWVECALTELTHIRHPYIGPVSSWHQDFIPLTCELSSLVNMPGSLNKKEITCGVWIMRYMKDIVEDTNLEFVGKVFEKFSFSHMDKL